MLIPVRGAVAATMLCLPSGSAPQGESHVHHEGMDHHAAAAGHEADPGEGHHGTGGSGKCTLCSACCSSASLIAGTPQVAAPPAAASAAFPDLSAPAPTFLSDGQERPPRSI